MQLKYNDRQHAYWLDGKRCKGVTTVAKIPDDTFHLEKWNKRMVAIGMAISPPLVQRGQAHFDERDPMDDIAEEALVAAKAHQAAGRGTAIHRETERADLGLDWIDTPETRAIRTQWTTALGEAGLEVVPEYVERIVVYPDLLVAGRFDRYCRTTDGRLVVVDVKTGENAIKYPHSTVCQLSLYVNAPLLAGPLAREGKNEVTNEFEPLPADLDPTVGYVVYLPPEGPGQVHRLDLAAGWEEAVTRICFPTITWRKRTGLIQQVTTTEFAIDLPVASLVERTNWLRNRVVALADQGHKPLIAANWPTGVPTLKQGGITDVHIDAVATMLDRLEGEIGIPFGASDPLFDGFATADIPPALHLELVPAGDPRAEAQQWTAKCRELLDQFDEAEADLVRDLVVAEHAATTERHHQLIDALIGQLVDPNGAVMFTYSTLGPDITPTHADDRIRQTCGTKTAALARAKNLAKELGRPLPRTFDNVCTDPALAALCAAGLGGADTQTTNSKETLK